MADVRPFRALRPRDDLAARVIAPPYDVLTEAEARAIAENRQSFVRVTRSEVDLPEGTDPHSPEAYAMARKNLDAFFAEGTLVEDRDPTYYFYGQVMGNHEQVGILAAASVAEYDDGRIARHELTRPDKEDDRTHHMDVIDAQVGLVFLAYRQTEALETLTREITVQTPAWQVRTDDGVLHRLWPAPASQVERIRNAWNAVSRLYVADGHHRSAAASRIHAQRKDELSAHFLVGLYPADHLQVLAYNRIVDGLNGLSAEDFLARVATRFEIREGGGDTPARRGEFAMYFQRSWWTLIAKPELHSMDPVAGLDVSILQDNLLGPILGIADPRRSEGIRFVGGIRGTLPLTQAVDHGAAVAFHLFPTSLDELFAVADAGEVMPPKSTWFEPKLREGVAVRRLRG